MFHELRLYQISPGRMGDVHRRFQYKLPDLFKRHNIRNVGRWTAVNGALGPLFVYLMIYQDLNERERVWAAFYADDEWAKVRAETNAGSEMVSRFTVLFLRPSNAWTPIHRNFEPVIGGVHELVFQQVLMGQKLATESFIRDTYVPAVQSAGGTIMMIAETISGPDLPQFAMMFAWPSAQAQYDGRLEIENNHTILEAFRRQQASIGAKLFDRANVLVLEPSPYALPIARLGRGRVD